MLSLPFKLYGSCSQLQKDEKAFLMPKWLLNGKIQVDWANKAMYLC